MFQRIFETVSESAPAPRPCFLPGAAQGPGAVTLPITVSGNTVPPTRAARPAYAGQPFAPPLAPASATAAPLPPVTLGTGPGRPPSRHCRSWGWLLALVLAPAYAGNPINLPDLGDPSELSLTPQMERKLGRITMRRLYRHLADDMETQSYLQEMGGRLAMRNHLTKQHFHFSVLKDPRINAFAAPGGVVVLNSGIFLNAQDQHETAAVLAHEIAHVTQRHLARRFSRRAGLSLGTAVALIGAIALASVDPELGKAAITMGPAALIQREINFTRSHEQEADRVGMQLLHRADYDPTGMPRFFYRLLRSTRYAHSLAPEFLRTHPLAENRMAETQALALSYQPAEYPQDLDFELTKARLELLRLGGPLQAAKHFRGKLEQPASDLSAHQLAALRYGYALALTASGEFSEAQEYIDALLLENSANLSYLLAAGRLELAQGRLEEGLRLLQQAQRLYPERLEPILEQAAGLLAADRATDAQRLLRDYGRFQQDLGRRYYELLAQAEIGAGFRAESDLALAEFHYLGSGTQKAIDHLKGTLQQQSLNHYNRQRIQARLQQLEQELALEKKLNL